MKEIDYKTMKFNPFNLLGKEWMLASAGNEKDGCNTMTVSWGHLGCMIQRLLYTFVRHVTQRFSWIKRIISHSVSWIKASKSRWLTSEQCLEGMKIR